METELSSSQRRVCLLNVDRLTDLPIEVVYKILQDVPIREVVRTSVLSRKWRFRWMSVPDLVFDSRSIPTTIEGRKSPKPADLVNHVLLLHQEKVSQFAIIDYLDRPSLDINRWILLLARKFVKKLILELPRAGGLYKMPSSLFSCQELSVLRLCSTQLNMPSDAKGFCNLVDLELEKVVFTNETITTLISNNPLQKLTLSHCRGFTHLNICAPNLKAFDIEGRCERINFAYTPNLEYGYIALLPCNAQDPVHRSNERHGIEAVIGGLINAKELHILDHFMTTLAICVVPERLHVTFRRLVYISLEMNLEDHKEVSMALCLFRSSPCLKEMHFTNSYNAQLMLLDEGESSKALLLQEVDMFPKLETVGIKEFKGTQLEMRFVRFIFLNAVVLQTMRIEWDVSCIQDGQQKAHALENMMQFQRTSPIAQAIFSNPV